MMYCLTVIRVGVSLTPQVNAHIAKRAAGEIERENAGHGGHSSPSARSL
jgi:hypothetical protein